MRDLEGLRERATVQLALAERDLDRRYVPRAEGGGRVADQERFLITGRGPLSGPRPSSCARLAGGVESARSRLAA